METARTRSFLLLVHLLVLATTCGGVLLPPPTQRGAAPLKVSGCTGELLVNAHHSNDSQPLTITAFFPLPDPAGPPPPPTSLHYLLPAAIIATEEVNSVLEREGYHIQLDLRDTRCDQFLAVHELLESVQQSEREGAPHLAVLGPGCVDVAAVSPLAHQLLLPQVTYANETSVPVITATEKQSQFPDLFFMVRNLYHVAKTALRVLRHFQWTEQVGFVYDDQLVYSKAVEQLVSDSGDQFTLGADENVSISVPSAVFVRIPEGAREDSAREFVTNVRSELIRVIAGLVGQESACAVVCEAKAGASPGEGFVFVFVGAYQENWEKNCTCQLEEADIESMIFISSQVKNTLSDDEFELGGNLARLKQNYIDRLNRWCPETGETAPNTFFATTYDSMLALGLAVKASIPVIQAAYGSEGTLSYNTSVFQSLLHSLASTNFTGASGRVAFSREGERVGVDIIQQVQSGELVVIGTYHSESETLSINESSIRWPGDGEVPDVNPTDTQKTASLPILIITLLVTVSSNIAVVVLMLLVIRHRRHRIFIASGMRLNYIVFTGAYMAFVTIYIFVLFESSWGPKMPVPLFTTLCILRLYMIMMSFTFTFGTLFVRAWRIYRIFNNPFVAKRKYTDTYLMAMVGFLAVVDIILVTLFVSVDSYGRNVSKADVEYDSFTACTYLGCSSKRYFVVGSFMLGLYKVMQMLLFIFVVSLVRRGVIERKIYDDSKFLAIALYVTAIVFLIGLPLQVLLTITFRIAEALAVNMVWVIVSTDVTLAVIYVPKLYQILYKKVDVKKLMTQKSKFYLYSESRSTIL